MFLYKPPYSLYPTIFFTTHHVSGNATDCSGEDSGLQRYLGVFLLGQFLHGIGGTTLYTTGVVFLDSCVHAKNYPMYQGIPNGESLVGGEIAVRFNP